MPLSNSTLRRYTPPTCTLAIAAKTSALSRFVGKSVLKDLRFELQFDDPRQPDDNRVTIRGDQTELDMLCEAVNSYVQNFLGSSSTQLPLTTGTLTAPTGSPPQENSSWDSLALPASGVTHPDAIASPSLNHETGKFDDSTLVPPQELNANVRSAVGGSAGLRPASLTLSLYPRSLATDIYLEPKGLLAHNLILGHLANEESGPVINLSVTQLFDLATALEEYVAEAVALPNHKAWSWKKAPTWAYTAAAVVVAVGVTATTMSVLNRPKTYQTATTQTANQQANPSPSPTTPAIPTPTAPIALLPTPTVPSPLSTAPKLPPPSPVKIPTAPSPLSLPLGNQRSTDSSLGSERPTTTIRLDPAEPATVRPQRSSTTVVPGAVASASGSNPTRSNTSPITSSPTVSLSGSAKRSPAPASPEKAPPQQVATRPSKPSDVAPPLPNLPSLKPTTTTASNPTADQSISSGSVGLSSPNANQSESTPDNTVGGSSLFDTIPQVKEVRDYLQDRWKPTSELTQILEYYVLLNSDGKVDRIIPINKAAAENLNRTNIPRPGERFVSPVEGEGNPKIRVVFSPDGKVETFYEGREGRN